MFVSIDSHLFITAFVVSMAIALLSGLFLLHPRVPLSVVRIHIWIISLPPLVSLLALVTSHQQGVVGPWRIDTLAWFMALFVLTIGLVIQRFSVHYLLGDRAYRKYFALFTLTTCAASFVWLSNDLRLLLASWGVTFLGLVLLIGLNRENQPARSASHLSGRLFALSWVMLLAAIIWFAQAAGHWQLSSALTEDGLKQLTSWEQTGIGLLLVFSVMIPAAQWPFQRWLLESVVAPTPVSAVMHAGLVNAGGILLTRFSPLFHGEIAQIVLLVLSSISVLIGTGILLVQVDYKRQLVASTIMQMGFMLIQCALGAYLAAIIHLVLHGLFKASLFLQAGSVLQHDKQTSQSTQPSFGWKIIGHSLGLFIGLGFWLTAPGEGYQLISALILGWSLSLSWTQLIAFGNGRLGRIAGIILIGGASAIYMVIHVSFHKLFHDTIYYSVQPPMPVIFFVLFTLLSSFVLGSWLARHRSSTAFTILYLWLVQVGESYPQSVESHPNNLKQYLS